MDLEHKVWGVIDLQFKELLSMIDNEVYHHCQSANLTLLKEIVLFILSTVSGVPMKDILVFKKISYQMTDAAAHNFQVDNIISCDFEVDHVPKHLLYQTYPCLKFIKKSA